MKTHRNHRNYSRSKVSVGATLTPEGGKLIDVEVVDLSMSGVFVRGITSLAMGSKCQICILFGHFKHELPIIAEGTVVRTDNDGVALRFSDVRVDSAPKLEELIVDHADNPEEAHLEISSHGGWIFTP
ncbi:MAG: PilZ domain-containing protein [Zetaproteobacteria bacterium CG12_big_fil_rev_8_21_14_0_65_54_13]|nr:MAG: PilZ domain-containing protein [Zetaproteobacteria bacterium CG23_combo_of_CG06-09_8_20_14_all_54_7]PIW49208.1 MAG: PilZ domain-containing protein [Zetaproteobacteria bacterium CG12_big_fil_rev_8_21_14_0_65_54_13]PIX55475.1 MAG: PilZ domain-containing protein [Zetaproteobacteria bacterium CG_4_10_14_3_um_filter_54_28]PJA29207.1 MAG: PilZ domain-containing protein [Zetaproteobacteria bacterium CG_4_9_14_3_um_filter_54_145]